MHENKMLKLKQQEPGGEQLPVVQALLDDANQQVQALTTETRYEELKINFFLPRVIRKKIYLNLVDSKFSF